MQRRFSTYFVIMTTQLIFAYIHLLTLGIGCYSIWARANALKKLKDMDGLSDVFKADNLWGLAAALWIFTGLFRAFGGLDKGTDYYLNSTAFLLKMGLFLLVFMIEIKPMITFIKWRSKKKKGVEIDLSESRSLMISSQIELALIAIIILLAVAMARGVW